MPSTASSILKYEFFKKLRNFFDKTTYLCFHNCICIVSFLYILHGSLEWKNPPQIILGPSDENQNLSRMDMKYTLVYFWSQIFLCNLKGRKSINGSKDDIIFNIDKCLV